MNTVIPVIINKTLSNTFLDLMLKKKYTTIPNNRENSIALLSVKYINIRHINVVNNENLRLKYLNSRKHKIEII